MAELAAAASGIDWPGLIAERFGAWAGAFFDDGQALWAAPKGPTAYAAWRAVALRDLTPEIAGLPGFAAGQRGDAKLATQYGARAYLSLPIPTENLRRALLICMDPFYRQLVTRYTVEEMFPEGL